MGDINDARRAMKLPSYETLQMHAWAQREVIRGALDADVLERAAMILKTRSRKPDAIITRAVRKVLGQMAATLREEGSRKA